MTRFTRSNPPSETEATPSPLPSDNRQSCRIYIGIDPGVRGGMVAICRDGEKQSIRATPNCKLDRYAIRHWLQSKVALAGPENTFALIEHLTGFIGGSTDGKKRNIASAHTMFTLGESCGILQMALVCCRITFFEIAPTEWQRQLGIHTRGEKEKPNHHKNRLKDKAQSLFRNEKITLDVADAHLLAYLCQKRFHLGT